jgi:hypothetical protein
MILCGRDRSDIKRLQLYRPALHLLNSCMTKASDITEIPQRSQLESSFLKGVAVTLLPAILGWIGIVETAMGDLASVAPSIALLPIYQLRTWQRDRFDTRIEPVVRAAPSSGAQFHLPAEMHRAGLTCPSKRFQS